MTSTGTVFDIGYQRYTGTREGRSRGRLAVYKDGFRTALAFGRGPKAKILPWAFIVILSGIGLIMAIVAAAANMMGGPGTADKAQLPSHGDFYGIASVIVFVFAAVVAPELLCPDRRNKTISLYLVRPITGGDYVIARWAAFLTVMLAALWIPQVILFLGRAGSDKVPIHYMQQNWDDIPKFLLAGAAMAVYATTLAMLTASFTTRRAYASVFLVGLLIVSTPFVFPLSEEIGGTAGKWISMFALTNIPVHINDMIFGEVSEITEDAPARNLPRAILIGWYFAWTLIPLGILWYRYKRLSA
jgi:ABC-2 type transport system permease protein